MKLGISMQGIGIHKPSAKIATALGIAGAIALLLSLTFSLLPLSPLTPRSPRPNGDTSKLPSGHTLEVIDPDRAIAISLKDTVIGKDTTAVSLYITGQDLTDDYVLVEKLRIAGLVAPEFELRDAKVHKLILKKISADGLAIGLKSGSVPIVTVGAYGTVESHTSEKTAIDVVKIQDTTDNGVPVIIKELVVESTNARGKILLLKVVVNELVIENAVVGKDGDLSTKDFTIVNVDVENFKSEDIREVLITVA